MISEQNIRDWYKKYVGHDQWKEMFESSVALITQILNEYVTAYPDDESEFDETTAALALQTLGSEKPKTPARVREILQTVLLQQTGKEAPQEIADLGVSTVPCPPPAQPAVQLRQAPPAPRTANSLRRGLQLSRAALSCVGKFHWIQRGQEGFLPLGLAMEPALAVMHPNYRRGVNHFWLFAESSEVALDDTMSMNCWESVLYCGFLAGLLTRGNLRAILENAVVQALGTLGHEKRSEIVKSQGLTGTIPAGLKSDILTATDVYIGVIMKALGGPGATRIKPAQQNLLIPLGDVVFINAMQHVCISAGRGWVAGNPEAIVNGGAISGHRGGEISGRSLRLKA